MADNYGAPLNGYPGANRNNNPEQMMEGIVSTILSEMEDFRLFAHVKVILYDNENGNLTDKTLITLIIVRFH